MRPTSEKEKHCLLPRWHLLVNAHRCETAKKYHEPRTAALKILLPVLPEVEQKRQRKPVVTEQVTVPDSRKFLRSQERATSTPYHGGVPCSDATHP